MTVFAIAAKGGWLMLVLALLSVAALAIIAERLLLYRRLKKTEAEFWTGLSQAMSQDKFELVKKHCYSMATPGAAIMQKGLAALPLGLKRVREAIESAGRGQVAYLETNLGALSTISAVAPLIGFLGTVTGMIKVFMKIGSQGVDIELLAGGIWEALITTVGGLIVGILAITFYNYLVGKVEKLTLNMEQAALDFVLQIEDLGRATDA